MREQHDNPATGASGQRLASALPRERADLDDLASDDVESSIITLVSRLSSATFDLLVLIGEFDARGTWALRGALSCAAWLADTCDIEMVTARNQVRVAKAMRDHPALHAAMAAGDVSFTKARMLVPHLNESCVDELIDIATTTPTSRLAFAIAAWSHRNETDDEIAQRHLRERYVSWRTDPDGMVTITARLAPADAANVCAVIDKDVTTHRAEPPAPTGARDYPSLGQQRADALVRVTTEPGGGSTPQTEVVVHVRDTGNTLADGTPLTDHAVTRLLPESFVSLLMHDAQRKPIDASPHRRFPTPRQRRVLDERFTECAHPGCHARVLLQADHVIAYDDDGPTTLDNLQLLCGPHNRAKEQLRARARGRAPVRVASTRSEPRPTHPWESIT